MADEDRLLGDSVGARRSRLLLERSRLQRGQRELRRRMQRLHAEAVRLLSTAELVHESVRRCEDTLHVAEDLIAGRPRR